MQKPRVLLADDHVMVRQGLVRLLQPDFEVVGEVGDGHALISEAHRLRPDAVVLDIGMPLLNGVEAAMQLRERMPHIRVLFLTQQSGKEYVQAAFQIGVCGYVLKNTAASELITALNAALAGHRYLSPELRRRFGDPDAMHGHPGSILGSTLTARQREVLQLVAEGKSAKEIAWQLKISVKTVEFHKAAVMDELGMRTTAELTRYALEHGIVAAT